MCNCNIKQHFPCCLSFTLFILYLEHRCLKRVKILALQRITYVQIYCWENKRPPEHTDEDDIGPAAPSISFSTSLCYKPSSIKRTRFISPPAFPISPESRGLWTDFSPGRMNELWPILNRLPHTAASWDWSASCVNEARLSESLIRDVNY